MKSLGILPATVQKENLGILDISVDFQGSWRRSRVHNKKKKKKEVQHVPRSTHYLLLFVP